MNYLNSDEAMSLQSDPYIQDQDRRIKGRREGVEKKKERGKGGKGQ